MGEGHNGVVGQYTVIIVGYLQTSDDCCISVVTEVVAVEVDVHFDDSSNGGRRTVLRDLKHSPVIKEFCWIVLIE